MGGEPRRLWACLPGNRRADRGSHRVHRHQRLLQLVTVLALDVINLVPILFAVAAIVPVYRLLGMLYAAMIAINVVLPVLMGGVLSMGRVTSVLFPLFIWLGVAVPGQLRTPWLVGLAMLQALFAIAFFTWRPLV